MKCFLSALVLVVVTFHQDGIREFNDGDFVSAYKLTGSLTREVEFQDQGAVHFNHALVSLRVGKLSESKTALELSCAWGDKSFELLRTFLLGNIAFAQCLDMEKLSKRVEAGLPAHDSAIALANTAVAQWIAALKVREKWPEAVRNIERAQMKLNVLQRSRAAFVKRSKKKSGSQKRKAAETPQEEKGSKTKFFEESIRPSVDELADRELKILLQRLDKKEKEKKRRRMQRRLGQSSLSGERDW